MDNGNNNKWDNGTIGNYWDDYNGCDSNNDGIGETPYDIPGNADTQDNYPITYKKCSPSIIPSDDDDEDEEKEPPAIPFGNYYVLFMFIGIISLVFYYKKRKF